MGKTYLILYHWLQENRQGRKTRVYIRPPTLPPIPSYSLLPSPLLPVCPLPLFAYVIPLLPAPLLPTRPPHMLACHPFPFPSSLLSLSPLPSSPLGIPLHILFACALNRAVYEIGFMLKCITLDTLAFWGNLCKHQILICFTKKVVIS